MIFDLTKSNEHFLQDEDEESMLESMLEVLPLKNNISFSNKVSSDRRSAGRINAAFIGCGK
jgi:hypothetical protein